MVTVRNGTIRLGGCRQAEPCLLLGLHTIASPLVTYLCLPRHCWTSLQLVSTGHASCFVNEHHEVPDSMPSQRLGFSKRTENMDQPGRRLLAAQLVCRAAPERRGPWHVLRMLGQRRRDLIRLLLLCQLVQVRQHYIDGRAQGMPRLYSGRRQRHRCLLGVLSSTSHHDDCIFYH